MDLRQFNSDGTKELLQEFLYASIDREALHRMYAGEDVSHIRDARLLIEKAFEELSDLYIPKLAEKEHVNHSK